MIPSSGSSTPTTTRAEQARVSREIDAMLAREKESILKRTNKEPKILLLGSGDSGKTTFMKQLKIIHGGGYSNSERASFRPILHSNLCDSIHALILASEQLRISPKDTVIEEVMIKLLDFCQTKDQLVTLEIAELMSQFFHDENIASILPLPAFSNIMIQDTAAYFLSNVKEFSKEEYLPTDQDILNLRLPTSQITATIFHINSFDFHIYDIGGQIKHRKQWTPYFDKVNQIIFFISLASYDQVLAEDPTINRMHDALDLFEKICNNPLLKHIPITLFLNKKDLFEKKLLKSKVKQQFPDYAKENTLKYASRYFEKKFLAQYNTKGLSEDDIKPIFTHITCCTDTQAMAFIISNVIQAMLVKDLKSGGLM
ncbi:hypothetical protein BDEG_20315 [Batrachochytrium dendrobatidis JEL423]|nr:hypothetical protein BDEG_20315 [Batrachochytrium dendrobatidis JEL423]